MQSFTFNGKSSLDILNEELFLCEFESSTNIPTNTREIIKGETNSYRNVANYFGTKDSDSLQLPIGFVKITGKSFSIYERDIIEGWLTDNEIPKPLVITDKNGKTSVFNGIVQYPETSICFLKIGSVPNDVSKKDCQSDASKVLFGAYGQVSSFLILSSAPFSSRETWAWEMPISSAISI